GASVRGTSEAAQAKRRKKVRDAAVVLAARGVLDALRIRDLVARTGVSSATIYRYRQPDGAPPHGTTPAQRVINLLRAPTDALTSAPQLAAAMLQAMTPDEPGVAPVLATITEPLVAETAHPIRRENPTPADYALARTIQRVCGP